MPSVLDLPERLLPRCEGSESTAQLELMCAGKDYDCNDPYLLRLKERGEIILYDTRQCKTMSDRGEIFKKVCNFEDPETGGRVYISHGFFCEYWFNVTFGRDIFMGVNCIFNDVSPIIIGSRTMLGPNVQLYTPTHPIDPDVRNGFEGPEASGPITIGDDCWIGGGVIILAGVTIGDGSTVGAGSVVTRSVPPRHVVVGNPARAIKRIEKDGTVVDLRKSSA